MSSRLIVALFAVVLLQWSNPARPAESGFEPLFEGCVGGFVFVRAALKREMNVSEAMRYCTAGRDSAKIRASYQSAVGKDEYACGLGLGLGSEKTDQLADKPQILQAMITKCVENLSSKSESAHLAVQAFAKSGLSYLYSVVQANMAMSDSPGDLTRTAFASLPIPDYYLFGIVTGCRAKGNLKVSLLQSPGPAFTYLKPQLTRAKTFANSFFSNRCLTGNKDFLAFAVGAVDRMGSLDVWTIDPNKNLINIQPAVRSGEKSTDRAILVIIDSQYIKDDLKKVGAHFSADLMQREGALRQDAARNEAKAAEYDKKLPAMNGKTYAQNISDGQAARKAKKYEEAASEALNAQRLDGNRFEAYFLQAMVFSDMNDFRSAKQRALMALSHAPDDKKSGIKLFCDDMDARLATQSKQ